MRTQDSRGKARIFIVLVLLAPAFVACGTVRKLRGADPPVADSRAADELVVSAPEEAAPPPLRQYWVRNTLVVDLQGVSGSGRAYLAPRYGARWPPRIAFRVRPGSVGVLEVRGDARVVLPVSTEGSAPVQIELAPAIYSAPTARLEVEWRPAQAPPSSPQSSGS